MEIRQINICCCKGHCGRDMDFFDTTKDALCSRSRAHILLKNQAFALKLLQSGKCVTRNGLHIYMKKEGSGIYVYSKTENVKIYNDEVRLSLLLKYDGWIEFSPRR